MQDILHRSRYSAIATSNILCYQLRRIDLEGKGVAALKTELTQQSNIRVKWLNNRVKDYKQTIRNVNLMEDINVKDKQIKVGRSLLPQLYIRDLIRDREESLSLERSPEPKILKDKSYYS